MSQKLIYSTAAAVDGFCGSSQYSWVAVLAEDGNVYGYSNTSVEMRLYSGVAVDEWTNLRKGIYMFPSTAMPEGSVITSGSFSCIPAAGFSDVFLSSLVLANAPTAIANQIAAADYQKLNANKIELSDTRHSIASLVADTRITFPLNAAGYASLQASFDAGGAFKLSTIYDWDFDEVNPGWQAGVADSVSMYGYSYGTAAFRPILTLGFYVGGGYATIKITGTKATGADVLTADNWAIEVFTK